MFTIAMLSLERCPLGGGDGCMRFWKEGLVQDDVRLKAGRWSGFFPNQRPWGWGVVGPLGLALGPGLGLVGMGGPRWSGFRVLQSASHRRQPNQPAGRPALDQKSQPVHPAGSFQQVQPASQAGKPTN